MDRRPGCQLDRWRPRAGRLRVARGDLGGGLRAENERLLAENARLRSQLEAARRAGKRQAAPFSKGDPQPHPRRPGRKSGADHGRHAHRQVPDHVDETIEVALPDGCPCCGGELDLERVADQFQEDIPVAVRPHVRLFRVGVGRCRRCGARAQGRHPLQSSDALGAAGAQVGPNAVALAGQLNKELGLPLAKAALVLAQLCGLRVSAGALHQALARLAAAAAPTYRALVAGVRASAAVAADETGWRVAGTRQWLWVFVGDGVTVYLIAPGRGYEQACLVLGEDYSGVLERDGWAPYRRFKHAQHQSCAAHLLRRAVEMIADALAGQAKIPHALRRLLKDALAVRDQYTDLLSDHDEVIEGSCVEIADDRPLLAPGSRDDRVDRDEMNADREDRQAQLNAEIARLERELDTLLERNPTHAPNRRLLGHLANEREHLLTFLKTPGIAATNWRAEQAIRPAVVNRKHWGGNRTWHGAGTQQVLMSVIRSARQQDLDPLALMRELLLAPAPTVASGLAIPRTTPACAATAEPRSARSP